MSSSKTFKAITDKIISDKLKPARAKVKQAEVDQTTMPRANQKVVDRTMKMVRKVK